MPLTLNGSGTIAGLNAGGLPDACITTDDIAANAVTFPKIGTTEQGQLCKAWVNFNGTGTVAVRASYNVSSITDNGVGQYTVNFTTAMPDANYCFQINAQDSNNGMGVPTAQADPTRTITTGALPIIYNYPPDITFYDAPAITVAIFR